MARVDLDEQCPNWRIKQTREGRIFGVLYGSEAIDDLKAAFAELRAARAVVDAVKKADEWALIIKPPEAPDKGGFVEAAQELVDAIRDYDKLINDGGE